MCIPATSPPERHHSERNQAMQMNPCWLIYQLFCVTSVSLSAFWRLHCLVVYLYHISSFIKNSVSGAGERALRSEVDRLLGNHPPILPSGAAPALAGSRWAPKGPQRRRGEARMSWCQRARLEGKSSSDLMEQMLVLTKNFFSFDTRWHQMRRGAHVFARQTDDHICFGKNMKTIKQEVKKSL